MQDLPEKELEVAGLKINYLHEGQGRVVLILHGWKSSAEAFVGVIKNLVHQGFEVVAPDLPGFGKSQAPNYVYGLDDYTHFVLDFIETIGVKKFLLLGHSFGGRVAIKFAYKFPHKLFGLVLCSAAGIGPRFSLKRAIFLVVAKIGGIPFKIPPLKFFRNPARRILYFLARESDYLGAGSLKATFKKVVAEDLTVYLKALKVPTLILWGAADRVLPLSVAHQMVKKISKAQLVVIDGASHKLPYEKPEEVSKHVVAFSGSLRK